MPPSPSVLDSSACIPSGQWYVFTVEINRIALRTSIQFGPCIAPVIGGGLVQGLGWRYASISSGRLFLLMQDTQVDILVSLYRIRSMVHSYAAVGFRIILFLRYTDVCIITISSGSSQKPSVALLGMAALHHLAMDVHLYPSLAAIIEVSTMTFHLLNLWQTLSGSFSTLTLTPSFSATVLSTRYFTLLSPASRHFSMRYTPS